MTDHVRAILLGRSKSAREDAAKARGGSRVETTEWVFVASVTLFILFVTGLPYLYGYLSAPPDKQFMGIMLDVPDHTQYFSWMRELSHSHLAANKLTPETNPEVFFNLLWWALGRLALLLGWAYPAIFQLLRVSSAILFLGVSYRICARFLTKRLQRRVAFLVIAFTSGFGWVLVVLKYTLTGGELLFPLDVYVAEGNTFLSILGYPHFIAAALYIFVFDLILLGEEKDRFTYAVLAGFVALFLGLQHAYDLVSVYGVLGAFILARAARDRRLPWSLIRSSVTVGAISIWPAIYSLLLTRLSPMWREVLAQFANAGVYTPNLLHLPILLGPAFLLAVVTACVQKPWRLKRLDDTQLFLHSWFWITFLLIYLPVDYQIHLLNGWQVPIAILATQGLFALVIPKATQRFALREQGWSKRRVQRIAVSALLLLIVPTNLYLLVWRFVELSRHDYPYYLHQDEIAALEWVESNTAPDDVILSSLTLGQYVPALTGRHAFLAHWAQTLDFYSKSAAVEKFFTAATADSYRRAIVDDYSVDYILYGAAELRLSATCDERSDVLRPIFSLDNALVCVVVSASYGTRGQVVNASE